MVGSGFSYGSTTDGTGSIFIDIPLSGNYDITTTQGTMTVGSNIVMAFTPGIESKYKYIDGIRFYHMDEDILEKMMRDYRTMRDSKDMILYLSSTFVAEIRQVIKNIILRPPKNFLSRIQIEYEKWKQFKLAIGCTL